MKIKTNHHWRYFLYGYELTSAERERFDWIDDIDSAPFIRYRNHVYSLDEFIRVPPGLESWDGYYVDSAFSAVVIKISNDNERYQIGVYTC